MASYPNIDTELLRSFVAIVDHGGFTRAAAAVNRTQSAISMQMKRRKKMCSNDRCSNAAAASQIDCRGQILLGYARRILKLHGEVMTTLRQPHMVGAVRIGTPDDYVMRFLPGILARFAQAYPLVSGGALRAVEPAAAAPRSGPEHHHCEPGTEIGQLLRQEYVVWAAAPGFKLDDQRPLPLATFNTDCFCRAWVCNALDAREIDYRIAYSSPSLAAIMAIVGAGWRSPPNCKA